MIMKKDNSKKYIIILIIVVIAALAVASVFLFILPSVYENDCLTRVYEDLEQQMIPSVLNANICIVRKEEVSRGGVTEYSYSTGASGVVFEKKQGIYYALTANHVVQNNDSSVTATFIVQPYGSQSYYSGGAAYHSSLSEYFDSFPTAKVEFNDEKSDLAIISFYTDESLSILPLAEKEAVKGDRIAVIGNPDGKRFVHSFGEILSDEQIVFSANDGKSDNLVTTHNAYTAPGSSGSAVLNDKTEIVGINIGGATDFMGRFRYSAMISLRQVNLFLNRWRLL